MEREQHEEVEGEWVYDGKWGYFFIRGVGEEWRWETGSPYVVKDKDGTYAATRVGRYRVVYGLLDLETAKNIAFYLEPVERWSEIG